MAVEKTNQQLEYRITHIPATINIEHNKMKRIVSKSYYSILNLKLRRLFILKSIIIVIVLYHVKARA